MIQFDEYFSNGLKPPTRGWLVIDCMLDMANCLSRKPPVGQPKWW